MTVARRVLLAVVVAAAFGAAAGALKAVPTWWGSGVGNLSAPWLVLALLLGLPGRTPLGGALNGLAGTLTALAGFYAVQALVLAGHLGNGYLGTFRVEVTANRLYFFAGLVSGPVFGAIGAWLGRHHPRATGMVVGALLAAEIAVVALVQGHQLAPLPLYFAWGVDDWTPYAAESVLGVAIVLVWLATRRRATTHA